MYISNQGTNAVLRFELTTGEPADVAPALISRDGRQHGHYPGLFAQFDPRSDGVRAIAVDHRRHLVYVADKDEGVAVFDEDGNRLTTLKVDKPIGVSYCTSRDTVLVGSKGDNTVTEWDPETHELLNEYSHERLSHPAGKSI